VPENPVTTKDFEIAPSIVVFKKQEDVSIDKHDSEEFEKVFQ